MIKIKFSNGLYMIWNIDDVIKLRKTHRIVGNFIGTFPEHPRQNESQGLPLVLMPEEVRLLQSLNVIQIVEQSFPNFSNNSELIEYNENSQRIFKEDIREKHRQERKSQILSNLDKIVEGKLRKSKLCLEKVDLEEFRQRTLEDMISKIQDPPDLLERARFYIESPFNKFKTEKKIQLEPLEPFSLSSLKYHTFRHFWSRGYFLTNGLKFGAHFLAYDHDPLLFHAKFIIICCPRKDDLQRFEARMTQAYGRLGKNVRKNIIIVHFNIKDSNTQGKIEEIQFKHIKWNPMVFPEDQIKSSSSKSCKDV